MVADLCASSPTAVELVNPKHRNEWKHYMAIITSYHVPGLYVEDHSIDVPLDWRGLEPMLLAVGSTMRRGAMPAPIAGAPESIKLFYRVVCAPDRINDDLPLLLFLQGGPGGESPRPLSPTSDGWIEEAVKHFRIVLPDQRGTGRSSCRRRAHDCRTGRVRDGSRLRCRTLAGGLPQASPRQLHRARF